MGKDLPGTGVKEFIQGEIYECKDVQEGDLKTLHYQYYCDYGDHLLFKTFAEQYFVAYLADRKKL